MPQDDILFFKGSSWGFSLRTFSSPCLKRGTRTLKKVAVGYKNAKSTNLSNDNQENLIQ